MNQQVRGAHVTTATDADSPGVVLYEPLTEPRPLNPTQWHVLGPEHPTR